MRASPSPMAPVPPQAPLPQGLLPLNAGDPRYVGPFRLVGRLGSGGMGVVYAALDDRDTPVAVKCVHRVFATDTEFRARFAREVDLVSRVRAACVPAFLGSDTKAAVPWLATAYVPGPTLVGYVRTRGPLTGHMPAAFALGVAEALAAIHAQGVVHRDLKPGNVILAPDGPQVLDFGIARAVEETALTATGQLVGTPGWIAPEQYRGAPATDRSDVFAWAGLVAFAATGRGAFGAGPSDVLAARVLSEPPFLEGVPDPLRGVLERALDKDPERRPDAVALMRELTGGAEDVARVLERTWAGIAVPDVSPDRWRGYAPPRRSWPVRYRRPLIVGGSLLALTLAAGAVIPLLPPGEATDAQGTDTANATGDGTGDGTGEPETTDVSDDVPEEYRDLFENGRIEAEPVSDTELVSTLVPASSTDGESLEQLRITFEEGIRLPGEGYAHEFVISVEYLPAYGEARLHSSDFALATEPGQENAYLAVNRPGSTGPLARVDPDEPTAEFSVTFFGYPEPGIIYYLPTRAMVDGRAEPGYPGGVCFDVAGSSGDAIALSPYDATAADSVPLNGCPA